MSVGATVRDSSATSPTRGAPFGHAAVTTTAYAPAILELWLAQTGRKAAKGKPQLQDRGEGLLRDQGDATGPGDLLAGGEGDRQEPERFQFPRPPQRSGIDGPLPTGGDHVGQCRLG